MLVVKFRRSLIDRGRGTRGPEETNFRAEIFFSKGVSDSRQQGKKINENAGRRTTMPTMPGQLERLVKNIVGIVFLRSGPSSSLSSRVEATCSRKYILCFVPLSLFSSQESHAMSRSLQITQITGLLSFQHHLQDLQEISFDVERFNREIPFKTKFRRTLGFVSERLIFGRFVRK